eukprot:7460-Heterococcus_DN1.PRE.2
MNWYSPLDRPYSPEAHETTRWWVPWGAASPLLRLPCLGVVVPVCTDKTTADHKSSTSLTHLQRNTGVCRAALTTAFFGRLMVCRAWRRLRAAETRGSPKVIRVQMLKRFMPPTAFLSPHCTILQRCSSISWQQQQQQQQPPNQSEYLTSSSSHYVSDNPAY